MPRAQHRWPISFFFSIYTRRSPETRPPERHGPPMPSETDEPVESVRCPNATFIGRGCKQYGSPVFVGGIWFTLTEHTWQHFGCFWFENTARDSLQDCPQRRDGYVLVRSTTDWAIRLRVLSDLCPRAVKLHRVVVHRIVCVCVCVSRTLPPLFTPRFSPFRPLSHLVGNRQYTT